MPSMNLSRALRFLLALALLGVWQGALLHPLQHVDAKGAFVHVPGGHAPKKAPGDKIATNALCDAIAAVAACVSGSAKIAVGAVPGVESIHLREIVALFGAPPPAYRSQAPPSLL
jgi:hypothetical protein